MIRSESEELVWISAFLGSFWDRNIEWVKQAVYFQPGNTRGKHLHAAGAHQSLGSRKSFQGECKYTETFMK